MQLLIQIEQKLDSVITLLQTFNFGYTHMTFTLEKAAAYLGIARSTLYKHTSAGNIAHYKPNGKLILFKREELDQWLAARRVPSNRELKQNSVIRKSKNDEQN